MLKFLVFIVFFVGSFEGLIKGDCASHECQNGAECRIQYAVPWLTIKKEHIQTCEKLANSPRSRSIYEAMCEIEGYYCKCGSHYHGERCEKKKPKFSTESTTTSRQTTTTVPYEAVEVVSTTTLSATTSLKNSVYNTLASTTIPTPDSIIIEINATTTLVLENESDNAHNATEVPTATVNTIEVTPINVEVTPTKTIESTEQVLVQNKVTLTPMLIIVVGENDQDLSTDSENTTEITPANLTTESTETEGTETNFTLSPILSEVVGENGNDVFNGIHDSTVKSTTASTTKTLLVEATSTISAVVPVEKRVTAYSNVVKGDCNIHPCQNGAECQIQYAVPWLTDKEEHIQTCKRLATSIRSRATYESMCVIEGYSCIDSLTQDKQNNALELVVLIPPAEFVPQINEFLNNVTALLRVEVVLKTDPEGPMIFKWEDGHKGERLNMEKTSLLHIRRSRSSDVHGVVLILELNFDKCVNCNFTDTKEVADFIEKGIENKDPVIEALKINKANIVPSPVPPSPWNIIIGVVFVFGFASVIFGTVRGMKTIQSPEWTIPEYDEIDVESNRENTTTQTSSRLILPTIQSKPVNPQLSDLHLLAMSKYSIQFPINYHYVNLKAGPIGNTPLHCVVVNSSKNQQQIYYDIEHLCRAGANLNAQNDLGETALYLACRYQKTQIIVQLLYLGADPSIRNNENSTPLHQAASNNDLRTIEEMLKYESVRKTINEIDARDRTPLEVSTRDVRYHQVAERLINSGAHMDHAGGKCDVVVCSRRTALHSAVEASNIQMIKFLVERGSNIDSQDREGQTPLFLAAQLDKFEAVRILVEMRANHEIQDERELTPLEVAISLGFTNIVELLASLPKREPPPVVAKTPRATKKAKVQTEPNAIVATPQGPAPKTKRQGKRKLPSTPSTSDEFQPNTPTVNVERDDLSTPLQKRHQMYPIGQNDYTPQGIYAQGTSELPPFSSVFNTPPEEAVNIDYGNYSNYDDDEQIYANL